VSCFQGPLYIDSPAPEQQKRLGFLAGEFRVPDDFDRMAEPVID